MTIIKKETIRLSETEESAINEVYGILDVIEGLASDQELIRFAEHIRNYLDNLMNYIEED